MLAQEHFGLGDLVGAGHVDQHQNVEIAITDMAIGAMSPASAMSRWAASTQSASSEIGTQTSVEMTLAPL
jgi:hypothetical protein